MKKCGSCQGVGLGMPHLFRVIVVGGGAVMSRDIV